ncbi:hypothetical protein DICPUDRAFT_146743 [Dictyostelium purpureum]|uniref:Uncharacterized protein n=1 Tax=Dictyostelium purpureum TaxID=5786 RepID=F0Z6M2_DICPU|nr:uncharacterized protein DICPUDRAFT_146743 [Dictyostelium purpureum]EGC40383.1 hypothetical protein DICPUDRAFT_146743 [Dictyostelium purpureum]|eukprot:XP_003283134.1 hypothetical protein DICPUDRAFT_146743 [Dictyostelium purpureum]
MKFIIVLLSIFSYIAFTNSQIFNGENTQFGVVSSISNPFKPENLTLDSNIRSYSRYDWSYMRINIRSNLTKFLGQVDIHPRVDEFTTFRVPNTQSLIFKDLRDPNKDYSESSDDIITGSKDRDIYFPGWQIWAELVARKTIVTYTTQPVTVPCEVDGVRSDAKECQAEGSEEPPVSYTTNVLSNSTETIPLTLPPKNIIDINSRTFVNYFVIVVQLDKGRIIDAVWDGDRLPEICKSCDSCIDGQCGVNYDDMQCDPTEDQPLNNGCQLKIMVAWAGRDKNNKPCQSINKIPSNFQKYSSTSIKKVGTGLVSDFFYKINENNNNPNMA